MLLAVHVVCLNNRLLGVAAGVLGVLGMLIQFSEAVMTARLTSGELPAWVVYGTAGSSLVVYTTIVRMTVVILPVLLVIGSGYCVGRQLDVTREYRRLIRTVAIGSTVGVGLCR